jgi:hypothetical protein
MGGFGIYFKFLLHPDLAVVPVFKNRLKGLLLKSRLGLCKIGNLTKPMLGIRISKDFF